MNGNDAYLVLFSLQNNFKATRERAPPIPCFCFLSEDFSTSRAMFFTVLMLGDPKRGRGQSSSTDIMTFAHFPISS